MPATFVSGNVLYCCLGASCQRTSNKQCLCFEDIEKIGNAFAGKCKKIKGIQDHNYSAVIGVCLRISFE